MRTTRDLIPFLLALLLAACGSSATGPGGGDPSDPPEPAATDPGTGPWQLVPPERVAEECGLDPDLLRAADEQLGAAYAVVRYGKLCHEYYPDEDDRTSEVYSATKTLGGVVTGAAIWQTRDLERAGPKTGPVTVNDRVDHWLGEFTFNPDARVGHVLGMVGFNEDLSFPNRRFLYDANGGREINRLSDVLNTAIGQDPERYGRNLEEFTRRFLFEPLGMRGSVWTGGAPDKIFGFSWASTVRDMARLGLLILNDGLWNGERLVSAEYIQGLTHPSFEDGNPGYGYLTWLATGIAPGLFGDCAPAALWNEYPHGELSGAPDCAYGPGLSCDQEHDVGVWGALGLFGQYIVGHRGLDLVLVGKDMGDARLPAGLWAAVRPALVALDPIYADDEAAFCAAYRANRYAPDWLG